MMRKEKIRLWIAGLVAVAALFFMRGGDPKTVDAQGGFSGVQSYAALVMNQVSGPAITPTTGTVCNISGSTCAIQNFGTASHWTKFCIVGGTVATLTLELEGSEDEVNWMAITSVGSVTGTAGCGVLEAAGYFTFLRVNVMTLTGTNPKVDVWYAGIATSIPGGGIIQGNKASQPVTLVPGLTFGNTALKSTAASIGSTQATLFQVSIYNPNTSAVFVTVTNMNPSNLEWEVNASSSRDIELAPGVTSTSGSTPAINCATAIGGTGDPTTGCVVSAVYKPFQVINTQVNPNGSSKAQGGTIGP